MDDTKFGTRDKRGNWMPSSFIEVAPFWTGNFSNIGSWLVSYVWPWNIFHMATAILYWIFIVPDVDILKSISWVWSLKLLAANMIGIFLLYGVIELVYYVKRFQGNRFKYNNKFPSENPSDVFWFSSQNLDNFSRSFLIGIPIWTAIEVGMLWAYANTWGTWLNFEDNWLWLTALAFLIPAIHEVHFFAIHRLIHVPILYKWIHSVHHNSINPSPWSSLSMHPIEHVFYFGEILWHLVLPSNPVLMLFNSHVVGYGALNGHIGYEKLEITDDVAIDSHAYAHHLHHKYFEVNYGGGGVVPLDKWFGYWHDGSKDADERMKTRFKKKRDRLQAKQNNKRK
jgi:sterol desaturase/sphingolipid hydroxylase (fatty acid hydroxylase superfamily)